MQKLAKHAHFIERDNRDSEGSKKIKGNTQRLSEEHKLDQRSCNF